MVREDVEQGSLRFLKVIRKNSLKFDKQANALICYLIINFPSIKVIFTFSLINIYMFNRTVLTKYSGGILR